MTAPTPGHARACALLYPGLFPDEAYRRHPQQIDRLAAELDRLAEQLRSGKR